MAEEKFESRDLNLSRLLPWTILFRGFQVAMDPKKLLLAAAGLVIMAAGWSILGWIFFTAQEKAPNWKDNKHASWEQFREDRDKWNLLYSAAGTGGQKIDANDLANSAEEFEKIDKEIENGTIQPKDKPFGKLRTWPMWEDRGPNPYLLVTGRAGRVRSEGTSELPWERGHFLEWLLTVQMPVLVEPLIKLMRPIVYLLYPNAGFWNRIYFLLVLVWTLATWGLFGGAITRMAAVELARKEKVGLFDALRFTRERYLSYFAAPIIPLAIVFVIFVLLVLYGLIHLIPLIGDIWDGVTWVLPLLAGLVIAILLVGLVGWPMMYATVSTEGSDSFDAISRSYSYVFQNPWQFVWYSVVALVYGAVLVFFVGFIGSMAVYMAKLGVSHTPFVEAAKRDPSYLFVWAPTSFDWQRLLLQGSDAIDRSTGEIKTAVLIEKFYAWNYIGAFLVTLWLYLAFLMVVGFGYSYFWCASTIIYLLMRRKVDDTDLDEVYLEDDDLEEPASVMTTPSGTAAAAGSPGVTMVEPPTLRTPPAAPVTPSAPTPTAPTSPNSGDGAAPLPSGNA